MLIGIDLLWVRPKIVGGTESVIRNLINGFGLYDKNNKYMLFVGRDTKDTFEEYTRFDNVEIKVCQTDSLKRIKRIAWENSNLDKLARSLNVDLMLIPVYSKPNSKDYHKGGIPYITVIHDLQALHYPEYFSKAKIIFAKRSWKKACKESAMVVTGSLYCKKDIEENYPFVKDHIEVIYDATVVGHNTSLDNKKIFEELNDKYGIKEKEYFYTVSSMMPHKNLDTLLKLMKSYKESGEHDNIKLIVSGVGGHKDDFDIKVKEYNIEDRVIDTGFVSNEERDALYENCELFLFPSEFEGFGLPPVEAMMKGARVVTTKSSCIEEVTLGKATYVESTRDINEWKEAINKALEKQEEIVEFPQYELKELIEQYMELFRRVN